MRFEMTRLHSTGIGCSYLALLPEQLPVSSGIKLTEKYLLHLGGCSDLIPNIDVCIKGTPTICSCQPRFQPLVLCSCLEGNQRAVPVCLGVHLLLHYHCDFHRC